jgi:hypothetical protein
LDEQVKVLTLNFFARRLTDRGIEAQQSDGKRYRIGLKLTPDAVWRPRSSRKRSVIGRWIASWGGGANAMTCTCRRRGETPP